ncbi:MAG: alpha/beta hydrolase-fold protein, partial [Bacteroidota bacterium]
MRLIFALSFLMLAFSNQIFAQHIARVESVKIQSQFLNQERELLIYTPAGYTWRTNEYFNVIYVFDSQNREFLDYTTSIISFLTGRTKSFIVVGITSPYNKELDYARNNDMLPVLETESAKSKYGKYAGNAENFLEYLAAEVIPYINENYRTLDHNIAVGHSLGASFILYSLLEKPNLFRNYIAISPNLAYEEDKMRKGLTGFDYAKIRKPTYIYLSHANEGIEYWKEWKPAREKAYSFFRDSLKDENIILNIGEYPSNNHWNTFPPSLNNALEFYIKNIYDK